ncbi:MULTISPECIES: thiol-disulfide oxidoreductase DCC family protein [Cytobacillus]|uniref:Thiol-disulfide oxidoreductase n=1 Tax=Cytobacillus kochii TaxID=859143 RepID=A0A248TEU3_9BACI|nr:MULTISPECIES: thiol-disulfide oxidoreductase DCC family protein [Cytobacillus]ASV66642.1 thiol-disulfide oxidoreductase [Cytobacillus kochii]MEA1854209.1 thiol-disulfide oxidoreductase DCC family protein [Cytobacillus sp. OWB-43]
MSKIILFDGECNFCDQSVQFILKRDHQGDFYFASLQGENGQSLLRKHEIDPATDSFIYIEDDRAYDQSTAVIKVLQQLRGMWKLIAAFSIIPKPIRDKMYQFIAKRRYKWFGKKESCRLPSPEIRKRFLD